MMREASIVQSQYGNPQPQIQVTLNDGMPSRALAVEVYRLAADIEWASQPFGWIVVPDTRNGIVYLELLHATETEANQGLEILKRLCP
jgi:hypothetical protein